LITEKGVLQNASRNDMLLTGSNTRIANWTRARESSKPLEIDPALLHPQWHSALSAAFWELAAVDGCSQPAIVSTSCCATTRARAMTFKSTRFEKWGRRYESMANSLIMLVLWYQDASRPHPDHFV
jgi:hypothetical protein